MKLLNMKLFGILLAALIPTSLALAGEIDTAPPTFPRLMGMNIGKKHYQDPEYQKQLAKLDVVILGFYKGWRPGDAMAQVVRNLKQLSGGKVLVGQYTVLNESYDDPKNAATLDVLAKAERDELVGTKSRRKPGAMDRHLQSLGHQLHCLE